MKIRIEMTKRETTVLKNIAVKYAPIDEEIGMIEDNEETTKAGTFKVEANNQAPIITMDLNEDLFIEGMKFGEECLSTVMTAINVLKPFFSNFLEKAKDRFSKWVDDPADDLTRICKHIAKQEENAGKSFIMGLIKSYDWIDVDEDHKVRKETYVHYSVSEIGDLGDVVTQAADRKYWFVKFEANGNFTTTEDIITATKWAEELGMTYVGKRVAE